MTGDGDDYDLIDIGEPDYFLTASMIENTRLCHIRWLVNRDLPRVQEIDSEWGAARYQETLRDRSMIGMVAELGEEVVGQMVYRLRKRHLHLVRIAVDPEHRRRGYGGQMIERLKAKLESHRREWITAEVDETDLATQLFLRAVRFKCYEIVSGEPVRYAFTYPGEIE